MTESRAEGESQADRDPDRIASPLPVALPTPAPGDPAARDESGEVEGQNLEDILGVGSSVLRTTLHGPGFDAAEFGQLEGAFAHAQEVMAATASPSAPGRAPENTPASRSSRCGELGYKPGDGLSAAELARSLEELERSAPLDVDFEDTRGAAELASILLQMLPLASNAQIAMALAQRLAKLTRYQQIEALEICRSGLMDLAETLSFEVFDLVFPVLSAILRVDSSVPLIEDLPRMAHTSSERAREAIWPHVADELLREPRTQEEALGTGILEFIDDLPLHAAGRATQRLCRLPGLARQMLAPNFFDVRQELGYRMFAYLLVSPQADLVGPAIQAIMRTQHVRIEGAAQALLAVDSYRSEHAEFLHHLLLALVSGRPSDELASHSCTLLNWALRRMDAGRRREPWVAGAITFLGAQRFAGARSTLQMIRGQRKLGVVRAWPSEARKEASRALDMLRKSEARHA